MPPRPDDETALERLLTQLLRQADTRDVTDREMVVTLATSSERLSAIERKQDALIDGVQRANEALSRIESRPATNPVPRWLVTILFLLLAGVLALAGVQVSGYGVKMHPEDSGGVSDSG